MLIANNIFRQFYYKNNLNIITPLPLSLRSINTFWTKTPNIVDNNNNSNNSDINSYKIKVTICGAAGKIGRIVSLFLKKSKFNLNICLHDVSQSAFELQKQLQIVNTNSTIDCFVGMSDLRKALKDSDIVLILLKTKQFNKNFHKETFEMNYNSVSLVAKSCIEVCPHAIVTIATNPVNLMVPAVCDLYKSNNITYYKQKIIGLASLNTMIANTVFSKAFKFDPSDVFVPITGGVSDNTIVPIFSQGTPTPNTNSIYDSTENLMNTFLQYKNMEKEMPFISGYAISKSIKSIIKAILGEKDIVENAYVATEFNDTLSKYLISMVDLNEYGILNVYGPPILMSSYEKRLHDNALKNLQNELESTYRKLPSEINKTKQIKVKLPKY